MERATKLLKAGCSTSFRAQQIERPAHAKAKAASKLNGQNTQAVCFVAVGGRHLHRCGGWSQPHNKLLAFRVSMHEKDVLSGLQHCSFTKPLIAAMVQVTRHSGQIPTPSISEFQRLHTAADDFTLKERGGCFQQPSTAAIKMRNNSPQRPIHEAPRTKLQHQKFSDAFQ